MGEITHDLEEDVSCVRSIFAQWRKLPISHMPRDPVRLMRLLRDIHHYPHPRFISPHTPEDLHRTVDDAFSKFLNAARDLSAVLPHDDAWYVLTELMKPRLPSGQLEVSTELLNQVDTLVRRLAEELPQMHKRGGRRRGPRLADVRIRLIVQAICWHVACIEGLPVTNSMNDDDEPNSRVARIIEATCQGMAIPVTGPTISAQIKAVKTLDLNAFEYWELRQVLLPSQ